MSGRERLIEIVGEAAALPAGEREAFVRASCPEAGEFGEAMSLLASHDGAPGFMDRPTQMTGAWASAAVRESPGTVVGRYVLRERLGEGGFGVVFAAEQREPVRRMVALKIVKLGMDTRGVVARFQQERQALALMDHPCIARVFDAGATESGRPYFVMELVAGRPITTYCDAARLGIPGRLRLFVQACRGVQHAHTKGVIHRDIKPGNVLVADAGTEGPACKIIDFGIAKAAGPAVGSAVGSAALTGEQRVMLGTPQYMSPEQAAGDADIDTRTDVYSLGVVLYELLAGATPVDPEKLHSSSYAEMQRLIREVEPPTPSTRLSRLNGSAATVAAARGTERSRLATLLRGELDWIVMRALERERGRRYDSAGNLAADVERYLAGEPVEAAPPSAAYRARKFVARHRVWVGAGAVAVASLGTGLGVAVWQAKVASDERDAQKLATQTAKAAEARADQRREETERIAAFQSSQLSGIDAQEMGRRLGERLLEESGRTLAQAGMAPEQIPARQEPLRELLAGANLTNIALAALDENIFQRALAAVDAQFKDQPVTRARLLQTLASSLAGVGLLERAQGPQGEALAIRRRELGNDHADTLDSITEAALLLRHRGRLPEAEELYREAVAGRRRVLGAEDKKTVEAMSDLADSLVLQGKNPEGEAVYREALGISDRALGRDELLGVTLRCNIGYLKYAQGDLDAAGRLFGEALEASRRTRGDADESTLTIANNQASVLQAQGKLAAAEKQFRDALAVARGALGDDHPMTLQLFNNVGHILYTRGNLAEAEPVTRDTLDRRRRVLKDDHWDTMQSIHNLGCLLRDRGRLEEAEPLLREALERRTRVLGALHQAALQSQNALGVMLLRQGHTDEGVTRLRETLAQRRATLGNDHPDTFESLVDLAEALMVLGNASEAEGLLREALAGRTVKLGAQSPIVARTRAKLGAAIAAQGRFADADEALLAAEPALRTPDTPLTWHAECLRELQSLESGWDRAEPGRGHAARALKWEGDLAKESAAAAGSP